MRTISTRMSQRIVRAAKSVKAQTQRLGLAAISVAVTFTFAAITSEDVAYGALAAISMTVAFMALKRQARFDGAASLLSDADNAASVLDNEGQYRRTGHFGYTVAVFALIALAALPLSMGSVALLWAAYQGFSIRSQAFKIWDSLQQVSTYDAQAEGASLDVASATG